MPNKNKRRTGSFRFDEGHKHEPEGIYQVGSDGNGFNVTACICFIHGEG